MSALDWAVADKRTVERGAQAAPLRVALLGFGVVGEAVARILIERDDLADAVRLTHVFNRNVARKRVPWVPADTVWTERIDEVLDAQPDVVVEVVGGIEPAGEWVDRALRQGAAVVTANKMLLAHRGRELFETAHAHGSELRFEAAVAGGVPLINAVRSGLAGDVITRIEGIVNGTCNHILSRMAHGMTMEDALGEAERLGYAEADASDDLDGGDGAAKLSVLAGAALNCHLRPDDIPRRSIRGVEPLDFQAARRFGCTIRQVATMAVVSARRLQAWVGPMLVPETSWLAQASGPTNVIAVTGKYGGTVQFSGAGAGGPATAVAVVSDLLALQERRALVRAAAWRAASVVKDDPRRHYVRFRASDGAAFREDVRAKLARHAIGIEAVLEQSGEPHDRKTLALVAGPCRQGDLECALGEIAAARDRSEAAVVLPFWSDEHSA